MALTWEDLRGMSLARQFPTGSDVDVVDVLDRVGPLQTQTARSAFLGLVARVPQIPAPALVERLSQAYEGNEVVRSSTLRGTVHTSTPAVHRLLDAATRVGQRTFWNRTLKLRDHSLEQVWCAIEDFSTGQWHSAEELTEFLLGWLRDHDESDHVLTAQLSRYFSFGHGGLVRRPINGDWVGQGKAEYTCAATLLGLALPDAPDALADLVRHHIAAHGPASRDDIAWWSGLGLRVVDETVAGLGDDLVHLDGPDGRIFYDLTHGMPDPIDLPGLRLLPEFDGLMCGNSPKLRDRFVQPGHQQQLWNFVNGLSLPTMLVDGRLTGSWRLAGSGRKRSVEFRYFARTRKPRKGELDSAAGRLGQTLGFEVSGVTIERVA